MSDKLVTFTVESSIAITPSVTLPMNPLMGPLKKEVWEQLEKAPAELDLRKDEIKILILDISPHSQISRVPIVSASIPNVFSVGASGFKTIPICTTENI